MKIAAALVLTATSSSCTQPTQLTSDDAAAVARHATQAICGTVNERWFAISQVADIAAKYQPETVSQKIDDIGAEIEQRGCTESGA